MPRPRITKISLWREWGVPDGAYHRYEGLKGIYWYHFSKWVKARDYKQFQGRCITCDKYVDPEDAQGGHILPARNCGFALLFHPLNVHLQHSKCNNPRFTPSAGVFNTINLQKRYGMDIIDQLTKIQGSGVNKEWSKNVYVENLLALNKTVVS